MLNLERTVLSRGRFTFSTLIRVPSLPLVLDTFSKDKKALFNRNTVDFNEKKFNNSFSVQGGMLCDEMGLGKTISMIALVLSHPREVNEEGRYSGGKGGIRAKIPTFVSKATLVVCPSQLVDQWRQEITSNSSLTCIYVAFAVQHRKLTYQALLDVDVVIVSEKFLFSNAYYEFMPQKREMETRAKSSLPFTASKPQSTHVRPLFHQVDWHRIILDEGNEVLATNNLDHFVSNFRWYVTGTPPRDRRKSLSNALAFLNLKLGRYGGTLAGEVVKRQAVRQHIFRRNMKDDVSEQTNLPAIQKQAVLVSLTPIEQTIYDATTFDEDPAVLRRYVGNPRSRLGSLSDPKLPTKLVAFYKEQMASHVVSWKKSQKLLEKAQETLRSPPHMLTIREIEEHNQVIGGWETLTIPYLERRIIQRVCQITCFTRLMTGESNFDYCDGCGKHTLGCLSLTCGHTLCSLCLVETLQNKGLCLYCQGQVDIIDSVLRAETKVDPEIALSLSIGDTNDDSWCSALRSRRGPKFAETAKYLKKMMSAEASVKIIMFSQSKCRLAEYVNELRNHDPETFKDKLVFCKGNVSERKKQLDRFRSTGEGSSRILLLSQKNFASGAHLPEATHVLLIDPVVGSEEEVRAMDSQAIARAHRLGQNEVIPTVRFVIQQTIDQDDYERAYGFISHRGPPPKSARSAFSLI